jgi:hypothetical protein
MLANHPLLACNLTSSLTLFSHGVTASHFIFLTKLPFDNGYKPTRSHPTLFTPYILLARGGWNGSSGNAIADVNRYTAHPNGYHAAVRLSEDYARRARTELDIDDPSIDTIQSLLLLEIAFTAAGKGKKAYMMLGVCLGPKTQLCTDFEQRAVLEWPWHSNYTGSLTSRLGSHLRSGKCGEGYSGRAT